MGKMYNTANHIYDENLSLQLCTCAQSMALGTRTKFQLQIIITTTISAMQKFEDIILESCRKVSETTPRSSLSNGSTDVVNIRPVAIQ